METEDRNNATRCVFAWSGGKDSSMALARMLADPSFEVVGLVTAVTRDYDRVSIHGVRRTILLEQAVALALPIVEAELDAGTPNAGYEAAWRSAMRRARESFGDFSAVVYGDINLEDVRSYRTKLAEQDGLTPLFPLWGESTSDLAESFIQAGFEAWLTCVDTTQIPAHFAGRLFDHSLLSELPRTTDPCGENGEFHTCVVDGPIMAHRIAVKLGERTHRDNRFEYCDLIPGS